MLVEGKPRQQRVSLVLEIDNIRKLRGMKRADLAKRIGVSEVSIGRYINEPQRLSLPLLIQLAEVLDCSVAQIIGESPLRGARFDGLCFYERISLLDQVYVAVPLIKNRLFSWEAVAKLKWQTVTPTIGAARLVRVGPERDADRLVMLEMPDDSMAPTILPGEELLIEEASAVRSDGIYSLRFGDDLAIKRVQCHPITRRLKIYSDNEAYATYSDIDPDQVDVVGVVVRRS